MRSMVLRLLALGLCTYMIIKLGGLWGDLSKAEEQRKALLAEKEQLSNDIDELKRILAEDSHTELIERVARERLGYVFPDEQVYIDTPGN